MSRLKDFVDSSIVPWIRNGMNNPPPIARFMTELDLALGDGAYPSDPETKLNNQDKIAGFYFKINGIILDDSFTLFMNFCFVPDSDTVAISVQIVSTNDGTTLFTDSDVDAPNVLGTALNNPRGFCHRAIQKYKDRQYLQKLEEIHAMSALAIKESFQTC